MPCTDTSAWIKVQLNSDETLYSFDFSKMTCSKEIGGSTGYKEFCRDQHIDEIRMFEFTEICEKLNINDMEDQFFLYLEWDALRTSIAQYSGNDDEIDEERYKILRIIHDQDAIEITQVTNPPKSIPKHIPCCSSKKRVIKRKAG